MREQHLIIDWSNAFSEDDMVKQIENVGLQHIETIIMPIYPVKNNKTGEEQTLNMTIANYEQWRKDNPDWDKDWSKGCASAQEVGDWQNKLISRNPGCNDVLSKASKAPGSRVKKI